MSFSSMFVCVVLSVKSSINFIWTNNIIIISKSQERIGLVDKPAQYYLLISHKAGGKSTQRYQFHTRCCCCLFANNK